VSTVKTYAPLVAARDAYLTAARARDDARDRGLSWRKFDREMDVAIAKFNALQDSARTAFGESRGGWRYDKKKYIYVAERGQYGRRLVKHIEFYRDRDGNHVGLVTHTDAKAEEVAAYAHTHGYTAELLPFSWLYPDVCIAVLLTLKAGASWPK
jgi:hypothetical protein